MPDYGAGSDPFATVDPSGLSATATALSKPDIARRAGLLTRNFADLAQDPAALVRLASVPGDDQEMLNQAAKGYTLSNLQQQADNMKSLPDDVQTTWFTQQIPAFQDQLRQVGYVPPSERPDEGGGWTLGIAGHDLLDLGGSESSVPILGAVTNTLGNALALPAEGIAAVGGPAIDAVQWPLRQVQHAYRAADFISEGPTGDRSWMEGLAQTFNPGAWAEGWDKTDDGGHYFRHENLNKATELVGGDDANLTLAKEAAASPDFKKVVDNTLKAWGFDLKTDPDGTMAAVGRIEAAMGDPGVQAAIKELGNGHVTFGRDVVRDVLRQDDFSDRFSVASIASGGIDAYAAIKTDPTLMFGHFVQADRAAAYGVKLGVDGRGVTDYTSASRALLDGADPVKRGITRFIPFIGKDAAAGLVRHVQSVADMHATLGTPEALVALRNNPKMGRTLALFNEYLRLPEVGESGEVIRNATVDAHRVLDFYESKLGRTSLLSQGGGHGMQAFIPVIGPAQQQVLRGKAWFRRAVDFAADAGTLRRDGEATPGALTRADMTAGGRFTDEAIAGMNDWTQLALDKIVAPVGRTARSMMVYPSRGGQLVLTGPDSLESLRRFAETTYLSGGTTRDAQQVFADLVGKPDAITGAVNESSGVRQVVAQKAIADWLEGAGLLDTPWLNHMLVRTSQAYGLTGTGEAELAVGNLSTTAALLPSQTAEAIHIPSTADWIQATRAQSLSKTLFGNYTRLADPAMTQYWKPLVLMRMAFIPRVAGEELLRGMVMLDPANLARKVAAEYGYEWSPIKGPNGLPLRTDEGHVAAWTNKITRTGQTPTVVDEFGTAIEHSAYLPSDFTRKAVLPDLQPYESMLFRPFTTISHSVNHWATAAHGTGEVTAFKGVIGALSRPLDGLATRLAAGAATPTGFLADLSRFPTRHEIIGKFVGAETLKQYRGMLDSPFIQQAMAHEIGTSVMGRRELNPGSDTRDRIRVLDRTAGPGPEQYKVIDLDRSVRTEQTFGADGTEHALAANLQRVVDDPMGQAALDAAAHYLTVGQADKLATAARDLGVASEFSSDLGAVRALKAKWNTLSTDDRAVAADLLDNGGGPHDFAMRRPDLWATVDHPATADDRELFHWLLHEHVDPTFISTDAETLLPRMQDAIEHYASTPIGQERMTRLSVMTQDPATGAQIARPPVAGQTRMYAPLVDGENVRHYNAMLADPQTRDVFERHLIAELAATRRLSDEEIVHLVDAMTRPDRAQMDVLASGLLDSGATGRWLPVSLAATPDFKVAEVLNKAVADVLGGTDTALGELSVLHGEVQAATNPASQALHTVGENPMRAKSFTLDPLFGQSMGTITPGDRTELFHLPDGKWVPANRVPDHLNPDDLESVLSAGIPYEDALHNHADILARQVLSGVSNLDRGDREVQVAHSVLEPLLSPDRGTRFGIDSFIHTSKDLLPATVMAPERVVAKDLRWESFTRWFFDGPFATGMRAISRLPLTLEAYGKRYAQFEAALSDLYRTDEITAKAHAVIDKLGLDATNPQVLHRLALDWEKGPAKLVDAKASSADFSKALTTMTGSEEGAALTAEEVRDLRTYLSNEQALHRMVDEHASVQAVADVAPFVHDPEMRSHMQGTVGTLLPFWFAQEQFLKRWARTFAESPAALEKLLLTHNGIRNIGLTTTDPNTGEETFVYPGTEQAAGALAGGLKFLTGGTVDVRMPVYAAMTGTAQFVVPGFSDAGLPSVGPTGAFALKALDHFFPELNAEKAIVGDRARPDWMDSFVPSQLRNLYRGFRGDMSDETYAREFTQNVIFAMANGEFPQEGQPFSKMQAEDLISRIREGTRGTMLMKGLLGFLSPVTGGAPQAARLNDLNAEIKTLFAEGLDPGQVYDAFRQRHQDLASAQVLAGYEVTSTERPSGAPLPMTEAAFNWAHDHADLIKAYPQGAAWLLPPETDTDVHSRQAYNQQLTLQLRKLRSPQELVEQLYFQEGADVYFAAEAEKNALLKGADNLDAEQMARLAPWLDVNQVALDPASGSYKKGIEAQWRIWSQGYQAAHPIFADQLTSNDGKTRRAGVRTQLDQLTRDPSLVTDDHTAGIRELIGRYQAFADEYAGLGYAATRVAQRRKAQLVDSFAGASEAYLNGHPGLLSFYNSVIKPDLPA